MRAWRVTVAADDEDLATAALWEAGTAGVEVQARARGARLSPGLLRRRRSAAHSRRSCLRARPSSPRRCPTWTGWRASARAFGPFAWAASSWRRPGTSRTSRPRSGSSSIPGGPSGPAPTRRPASASARSRTWPVAGPWAERSTWARGRRCSPLRPRAWAPLPSSPPTSTPRPPAPPRHHARINGARLGVVRADGGRGLRAGSFDLVVANLMALLLVDRAAEIGVPARPGRRARPLGAARGRPPVRPRSLRGLRHPCRAPATGSGAPSSTRARLELPSPLPRARARRRGLAWLFPSTRRTTLARS